MYTFGKETLIFLEKTMTDFITLEHGLRVRHGVGMLILNREEDLLAGLRAGTDTWQLPQGGRDFTDEARMPEEGLRELWEELAIEAHEVMYAGTLPQTTFYELPPHMRKRGFDAQRHHWLVYHYLPAGIPDPRKAQDHEFDEVAWTNFEWMMRNTSPFRLEIYTQVRMMYRNFTAAA